MHCGGWPSRPSLCEYYDLYGAKSKMRVPVRRVKPSQEDMSQMVVGLNPGGGKVFFAQFLYGVLSVEFIYLK